MLSFPAAEFSDKICGPILDAHSHELTVEKNAFAFQNIPKSINIKWQKKNGSYSNYDRNMKIRKLFKNAQQ